MNALPLHPDGASAAAPAPDRLWVPIDEAAILMGRSEGHLRRMCDQLAEQGQARKLRVDRAAKWHIHITYSPRLRRRAVESDGNGGSKLQDLLASTTAAKRDRAQTDARILIAFRRFRTQGTHADLESFRAAMTDRHGRCPGRSRLYEMDKLCPCTEDIDGLIYALIDRRGRPGGDRNTVSDAAWSAFCDLYLTPRQWSIAKCWRTVRTMAESEGWAWPGKRRVAQLVTEKLSPDMCTLKREGRDAYNRKFVAPLEQDPEAWYPGQLWESDHSVLDLHCRVIKGDRWVRTRPQLTAWLDRRTRLLCGWRITPQGNEHSIRAALLHGLKREGVSVPEAVWIDNGKDFMARSIGGLTKQQRRRMSTQEQQIHERQATGILTMLKIEPHFANAYNHNGKARLERFFGTVHGEFDKEFASYSGYKPGMLDKLDHQATQEDVMSLPTLDQVRAKFEDWAVWYNHRAEHDIDDLRDPHTLERLSPIEHYNRFLPAVRTVDRAKLRLLEPVWSNPLKVHKWGVSLRIDGNTVRYGEMEPSLEPLVGTDRRVFVSYDPEDMGTVNIWDSDFRHLCAAQQNGRYGGLANDRVKREDLKRGFDQRRAAKRRLREKIDVVTGTLTDAELASRAAREREVGQTKARLAEHRRTADPADTPPLRLVQTRLDRADHDDIQDQKYRKAAGAEEFVDPDEHRSIIDAARELHLAEDDEFAGHETTDPSHSGDSGDWDGLGEEFADGDPFHGHDDDIEIDQQEFVGELRIMDHLA